MNQMSYLRAPQTPPDTKPQEAAKPRLPAQSPLSWTLLGLIGLLLVAVIADAPVRDFARGIYPQTIALLKQITQFGNAAWPLGLGIIALALCALPTAPPRVARAKAGRGAALSRDCLCDERGCAERCDRLIGEKYHRSRAALPAGCGGV